MRNTAIFLIALGFHLNFINGAIFRIQLNHWNDISSQVESFEPLAHPDDPPIDCLTTVSNKCIGGLSFLTTAAKLDPIDGIKEENFITLSSGNFVGGENGWLSIISDPPKSGWTSFGELLGQNVKPTVMTLGIKEFSAGISRTLDFINGATNTANSPPIIISNIKNCDTRPTNSTESIVCEKIVKQYSKVVTSEGGDQSSIGIVGFINKNVEKLGSPGTLEFDDIIVGLKEPIQNLTTKGINFLIAVGDGSLSTAQQIIDAYPQVKVVIFGRALGPSTDMTGNYPTPYRGSYIATAGKYGSSIGKMIIDFDSATGAIQTIDRSKLVPINTNGTGDINVAKTVGEWRGRAGNASNIIIGKTHVTVHGGDICWTNECNLGNIMADAAVHCVYDLDHKDYTIPEGTVLGIWHGGALFYDKIAQKSNISALDVHKWLPFHNNVHLVSVKGSALKRLFEASATALDSDSSRQPKWGQFLQVSNGMQVSYSNNGGRGVLDSIRVISDHDTIPSMKEIEDSDKFLLAMPSFLREGRSIFDFVKNDFFEDLLGSPNGQYYYINFDDECLKNYIIAMNGLITGFEERIFMNTPTGRATDPPKCKNNTAKHVLITLFVTLLIVGGAFVGWKVIWPRLFTSRYDY